MEVGREPLSPLGQQLRGERLSRGCQRLQVQGGGRLPVGAKGPRIRGAQVRGIQQPGEVNRPPHTNAKSWMSVRALLFTRDKNSTTEGGAREAQASGRAGWIQGSSTPFRTCSLPGVVFPVGLTHPPVWPGGWSPSRPTASVAHAWPEAEAAFSWLPRPEIWGPLRPVPEDHYGHDHGVSWWAEGWLTHDLVLPSLLVS